MNAVQLTGFNGLESLQFTTVEKPRPKPHEVLLQVQAAGINFAETELITGRYPSQHPPPFTLGWEAAGTVVEVGADVRTLEVGDKITTLVSSGAFADYATADAALAIPIPLGVTFAAAVSIPLHGVTAAALLKFAAKPQPEDSLLIQAAAGGVGHFLVQLAKLAGVQNIIALAGSPEKVARVTSLGANVAIDYSLAGWADRVRAATGGRGVDIILEAAAGEVGQESFRLLAPFGRIVMYGAKNIHEALPAAHVRQIISQNQSIIGFNLPAMRPEQIGSVVPDLLMQISAGRVKLVAETAFPLHQVRAAFEALLCRKTMGKVVLLPAG